MDSAQPIMQDALIAARQWQTMIILDACRFDVFERCVKETTLTGSLHVVDSDVIHTEEWYYRNWQNPAPDVVLVSGHPKPWQIYLHHSFYRAVACYMLASFPAPGPVLDEAVKAAAICPGKRLLVHLVPPHLPFVGKQGAKWLAQYDWGMIDTPLDKGSQQVYTIVRDYGKANGWDDLRAYYAEGLLCALGQIERVINDLPAPVIITADHGEMIGEDGKYRHSARHPAIQTVPWMEVAA